MNWDWLKLDDSFSPSQLARVLNQRMPNLAQVVRRGALPKDGRTVASLSAYLANNAVFNLLDFDGGPSKTADQNRTALDAMRAEQVAAGGGIMYMPRGIYSYTPPWDLDGTVVPIVVGEGENTRLDPTATAAVAIRIAPTTDLDGDSYLEGFRVMGNATCLGGIQIGTATKYVAFPTIRRVRVDSFTMNDAYGLSLERCQEFRAEACMIRQNYNNVKRPNSGFLTSAVFDGGYIGRATNRGMDLLGAISDLTVRNKCVIEKNAKEGIYQSGASAFLTLDDAYVEDNMNTGGATDAQISVLGVAGALGSSRLLIINSHFKVPNNAGAAQVRIDHCDAIIRDTEGLESGANFVPTANSIWHIESPEWSESATNWTTTLEGKLGRGTWELFGGANASGRREFGGDRDFYNSHLHSRQQTAPTVAVGAGAGVGATATMEAGSTDTAMVIELTNAGTPAVGDQFTVTLSRAYPDEFYFLMVAPINTVTGNANWNAWALTFHRIANNQWKLYANAAPTAGVTTKFAAMLVGKG